MAKYLLAGENIDWLAIMALLTFFIIFSLVVIMAFGRKSSQYDDLAKLPLEDHPLNDGEGRVGDGNIPASRRPGRKPGPNWKGVPCTAERRPSPA